MAACLRIGVKRLRTLFKEHYGIDVPDIPVAEILPASPKPLVLAKQKVRRVAGASLSREEIPDSLHLHICYAAVPKLHHDIHGEKWESHG
jgi:hypothetical protein